MGKFLASCAIAVVMIAFVVLQVLATSLLGYVEVGVVLIGALGLLLYAMMVIALGLVFSAWTENQIVAFTGTLAAQLALLLVGFWGMRVGPPFDDVLRHVHFSDHVSEFGFGLLRLSTVFFFVGLSVLLLYMAATLLARRRWHEGG